MHSEKKMTKEDTWREHELQKHIRKKSDFQAHGYNEDNGRKRERFGQDEDVNKVSRRESGDWRHRIREETSQRERDGPGERSRHRDADKEGRQDSTHIRTSQKDLKDRDGGRPHERVAYKDRDRDGTREKKKTHRDSEKYSNQDGGKDEIRDRTAERDVRERESRKEQERERDVRERERRKEQEREGDVRERERRKEQERERDVRERERRKGQERERAEDGSRKRDDEREGRDRGHEKADKENRERRKEERDRERRRAEERAEDRDMEKGRERKVEKDRHADRTQTYSSRHWTESDGGRDLQLQPKRGSERRERHSDKEHSRPKEDREYREHRRREKEERGRRRREQEEWEAGESQRHDRTSRNGEATHRDAQWREQEKERERQRERRHSERGDHESRLAESTVGNRRRPTRDDSEKRQKEDMKEDVLVQVRSSEDQGHDEGAEEYEDDFEDYEEDFEEDDESEGAEQSDKGGADGGGDTHEISPQEREEVEAIQRAMEAENERLRSTLLRPRPGEQEEVGAGKVAGSSSTQSRGRLHGKFMDFVAAKHREVSKRVASKQKKRSTEILRLVDLDFSVTLSLLDLPPVNEYDMYIKAFGTTNTKQAYVQCNEDNIERDVQTEDIEMSDRWTQHPGDCGAVCGGSNLSSEDTDKRNVRLNVNSQRLTAFLLSASQVMSVLLEEERAEWLSERPQLQSDALSFSDGGLQLSSSVPFLQGREVSLVVFSQVQHQTVLTMHRPLAKPSGMRLDSNTILCVWNIWEPSRPQKILVYESEVHCCCFSPGKATLVFAGTAVGSLVLWDLREHFSLHCTMRIGNQDWTLRYPTFSTDAVLAVSGHLSPVMSVEPIPPAVTETQRPGFNMLSSQEESSGLSFQLASLDENGVLNIWVVVELLKIDQAGSQNDLGLIPGGKVKLLHSSTIAAFQRFLPANTPNTGPVQSLMLRFLPSDSTHYFIGTNMSVVTHGTRHGSRSPPLTYGPRAAGLHPAHVTSLDFSPSGEPVFLVGCDDGSMRLHTVASEVPIVECSVEESVVSVQWSVTRPAVFCVLDSTSVLHLWDLLQKDFEPVVSEKVQAGGLTTMAVFGDPTQNTFSGLLLARQSGKIDVQYLNREWTVPSQEELEKVQHLVSEAY